MHCRYLLFPDHVCPYADLCESTGTYKTAAGPRVALNLLFLVVMDMRGFSVADNRSVISAGKLAEG